MKSCLDCCNCQPDTAPDGYCKLANHPAVIAFCNAPETLEDADMSACPGFVEDL